MKKYAMDLLSTDKFIPKHDERLVIVEWIEPTLDEERLTIIGYFEDNGDPYERVLDLDSVIDVRTDDEIA